MSVKTAFKIPTVEEVAAYMKEKKQGWPAKFIEYYAAKFWDHYQSVGWRISGRAMMKDWQAAFRAQWQAPKYDEDIKMLQGLQAQNRPAPATNGNQAPKDQTVAYLDEVLRTYSKHPTEVSKERLANCYDWLKEHRLIKLTAEQRQWAIEAGNTDVAKGKALAVGFVFDQMAMQLKTFAQIIGK